MCANNYSKDTSDSNRWLPRCGGCLLVILLIPLIYYGLYFILRGQLPSDIELLAHRGGPVNAPENTMKAFRNAIEMGVDGFETDIQRSKDGVLVIMHDETVDRTTNGTGRIGDLTFDQIRALDAGDSEIVPTFDEAIKIAKEGGVILVSEAKNHNLYPGLGEDMLEVLKEANYVGETVVLSFDHETLERMKEIETDLKVCPSYGLWALDLSNPQPQSSEVLCPMAEMVILNPWMINQADSGGREVYIWFGAFEHPIFMRIMLSFGVDGLLVDDPIALSNILGR